jgi:hypothetical protein
MSYIELNPAEIQLTELISNIKGVSFASFEYENKLGEFSSYLVNVGLSYERLKQEDIETLENSYAEPIMEQARLELIASLQKPDPVRSKAQIEAYDYIAPNIKVHKESGQLYIIGYLVSKTVLIEGSKADELDTRKPLTKAKDAIRKTLKSTKYRQFILDGAVLKTAKVLGTKICL